MSVAALEINDAGLILASGPSGSSRTEPSPGFGLIDGSDLMVGREALFRARLHPRHLDHSFWDQLDTVALGRPFPARMSRADLAHAHLLDLWRPGRPPEQRGIAAGDEPEAILAVPGWYSVEQLGLLLGIARAAEIPVTGMVDSALAAIVASPPREGRSVHLELFLHRVTATCIDDGETCSRGKVETTDETGAIDLQTRWAGRLSELFVRRTRFDPLLEGRSEQQLHDRLPQWLELAGRNEAVEVAMSAGGEEYSIDIDREEWLAPVAASYERIVDLAGETIGRQAAERIRISSRVAALPGIVQRIADATGVVVETLEEGAAARGALLFADQIREPGESLPFVTRLARTPTAEVVAAPPASAPSARSAGTSPTHVLHRDQAHPLTDEPFVIGAAEPPDDSGLRIRSDGAGIASAHCRIVAGENGPEVEDSTGHGTFVNGDRVHRPRPLRTGDVLTVGSPPVELRLIRVVDRACREADRE